jgi:hypothetical protein
MDHALVLYRASVAVYTVQSLRSLDVQASDVPDTLGVGFT